MGYYECIKRNNLLRKIKDQRTEMSNLAVKSPNWWLKLMLIKAMIYEVRSAEFEVRKELGVKSFSSPSGRSN